MIINDIVNQYDNQWELMVSNICIYIFYGQWINDNQCIEQCQLYHQELCRSSRPWDHRELYDCTMISSRKTQRNISRNLRLHVLDISWYILIYLNIPSLYTTAQKHRQHPMTDSTLDGAVNGMAKLVNGVNGEILW